MDIIVFVFLLCDRPVQYTIRTPDNMYTFSREELITDLDTQQHLVQLVDPNTLKYYINLDTQAKIKCNNI